MHDDATRTQPLSAVDLTATRPPTDPAATRSQSDEEKKRNRFANRPDIPGYAILEVLGEGGMGVVFKAIQLKLNRTVALKMVHGGRTASAKELIRFLAEAEAVAAIDHPHVVKVFDTGDAGGHPYLAMEYLPGGSLSEKLKASPGRESGGSDRPRTPGLTSGARLDPRVAADLIRKLALAVQAAHDCQIVHRDLKPSNVLFDANNEPRVVDFGLAKKGGGGDLTNTNAIMGTAAYMAPEQAKGESKFVGPAADVWALGVILYECLTGARPFTGSHDLEIIRKVVDEHPSSLRSHAAAIPKDLELIVEKCLAKDPTGRYPTAAALAEDLRKWQAGEPVSVKAAGPIERSVKWVRRNKIAAAIMAVSLLAALITTTLSIIAYRAYELAENEARRADAKSLEADNEVKISNEAKLRADEETRTALAATSELLTMANEKQFILLFDKYSSYGEKVLPMLLAILDARLPGNASDDEKEKLARQQTNAAVALFRINHTEKVWPLLKHQPDPRLRSYIIHRLAPLGADPKAIIARIDIEPEVSIRRALILSLGEFNETQLALDERQALLPKLQQLYRDHPDAGLHAAAEWLLRLHSWNQETWLKKINDEWAQKASGGRQPPGSTSSQRQNRGADAPRSPSWFVNSQSQTMIAIPGSIEFLMGSPNGQAGVHGFDDINEINYDDVQHLRRINRNFAVSAKLVTREQYCKFDQTKEPAESPVRSISWHKAAAYCNWLSEREGISQDQCCYVLNEIGEVSKMKPNYLSLNGYRLPTEAELEYATRAGSKTSRCYGETNELIDKYAWCSGMINSSPRAVGELKNERFWFLRCTWQCNVLVSESASGSVFLFR